VSLGMKVGRMKLLKKGLRICYILLNLRDFFGKNETPIGFIAGNSKKTYQGITFYLAELCINNEIQGKGYGFKLLQFLEEELQKKNVKSIYLLTSNGGLAENFYRKNGYVVNNNRIVMKKNL
jgi:aminoglycoside 6'-N-acetyltransferase I